MSKVEAKLSRPLGKDRCLKGAPCIKAETMLCRVNAAMSKVLYSMPHVHLCLHALRCTTACFACISGVHASKAHETRLACRKSPCGRGAQ